MRCSRTSAPSSRVRCTPCGSIHTPNRRRSSGCGGSRGAKTTSTTSCDAMDPLWYKDAIIYELHVKAFLDSNADGIGDFRGLTEKLDYLEDLGVNALWLLPMYPSPF